MPAFRAAIESGRKSLVRKMHSWTTVETVSPRSPKAVSSEAAFCLSDEQRLARTGRGCRRDAGVCVSLQGHLPTERTNLRENLRDCYRDLIRWNALHTAGINGLYYIAIANTTHDGIIHIDQPQSRRRVYQPKRSAACRPINVVPCHRIKGTGGRIPTEIYLMCDRGACTVQRNYCRTSVGRVAIDCDLSHLGSGCGWLEL